MPETLAYLDAGPDAPDARPEDVLDAITTLTAAGAAVHVRIRNRAVPVCDVRFTRAELRAMLDRCDALAAEDATVELPAVRGRE